MSAPTVEERAPYVGKPEGEGWEPVAKPRRETLSDFVSVRVETQRFIRPFRAIEPGALVVGSAVLNRIVEDPGKNVFVSVRPLLGELAHEHVAVNFGIVWTEAEGFHSIDARGLNWMPDSWPAEVLRGRKFKPRKLSPVELWAALEAAVGEHGFTWADVRTAFGGARPMIDTAASLKILNHVGALPVRERGRYFGTIAGARILTDFDKGDLAGGLVSEIFAEAIKTAVAAAEKVEDLAALVGALTVGGEK